ncbi:hypothetical protein [Nocardia sp. NPDC059195]|uniref:hypothetical protein n=1 Tax=Nocardia sp. NPDC059195 TaxID=3346765 RepID=UPI00368167CB
MHPYYDGNGRTARLLTTLVLHRAGYGLKSIYSLDEHYARNLSDYYAALTVGPSHNYYLGHAEADLTSFLDFFCESMAAALGSVRARAADVAQNPRNATRRRCRHAPHTRSSTTSATRTLPNQRSSHHIRHRHAPGNQCAHREHVGAQVDRGRLPRNRRPFSKESDLPSRPAL